MNWYLLKTYIIFTDNRRESTDNQRESTDKTKECGKVAEYKINIQKLMHMSNNKLKTVKKYILITMEKII